MTRRLLLVEPSATMRDVLERHVRALGHEVEATASYAEALGVLQRQYRAFESDIAGVLYGWPSLPDAAADAFAERLDSVDFEDLPVVVMSTDMRAGTRAWVAGRERTAVLSWKDYLGVDALLERLLGTSEAEDVPRVSKFDNGDIRVLVVDDSLTIRYSLRDLFELQGYRVGLAATREEALALARAERFDIAVLDFYLEETTGDALCRELVADPACGSVVCAVLTGTYADHVIKRSLRAGAVECMFKNESSELLLTRIDAIARFVRQRRELADGLGRLERALDTIGGAVLLLDGEGRVGHASAAALAALALTPDDAPLGRAATELLGEEHLPLAGEAARTARWRDGQGQPIDVSVARLDVPGSEDSLLAFERLDADAAPDGESAPALVEALALPAGSLPFVEQLERHLRAVGTREERVSLLVIGLFERSGEGAYQPLEEHGELARRAARGLRRLYRREHHVAALGGHRFGLLIRHSDAPQSYLLTRRLMQLADRLLVADGGPTLASTGCLVGLAAHAASGSGVVLRHALGGLSVVDARGVDQALLLDLRRMLAVHPTPRATRGSASGEGAAGVGAAGEGAMGEGATGEGEGEAPADAPAVSSDPTAR